MGRSGRINGLEILHNPTSQAVIQSVVVGQSVRPSGGHGGGDGLWPPPPPVFVSCISGWQEQQFHRSLCISRFLGLR
uniref:Uncharacterized protein n=1 Tax=Globodera rostochiensis TaxID=31243 RepID=A0A914HLJ9_GLORO